MPPVFFHQLLATRFPGTTRDDPFGDAGSDYSNSSSSSHRIAFSGSNAAAHGVAVAEDPEDRKLRESLRDVVTIRPVNSSNPRSGYGDNDIPRSIPSPYSSDRSGSSQVPTNPTTTQPTSVPQQQQQQEVDTPQTYNDNRERGQFVPRSRASVPIPTAPPPPQPSNSGSSRTQVKTSASISRSPRLGANEMSGSGSGSGGAGGVGVGSRPHRSNTAPSKSRPPRSDSIRVKKDKPSHVDVIDKLDFTGFGGFHHEGPFDAASARRNAPTAKLAPMAAFDPSALADPLKGALHPMHHPRPQDPPPGVPNSGIVTGPPRTTSKMISPRAQAALSAMDDTDQKLMGATEAEYTAIPHSGPAGTSTLAPPDLYPPGLGRRSSDSSINMGFPHSAAATGGKGGELAEVFGIMESEPWQDFGGRSGGRRAAPRESVYPGTDKAKMSRDEWRAQRAASVWDMEATLKAGKPVAAAPPVPALPPMPNLSSQFTSEDTSLSGSAPKRSKSLMQRIRKAAKSPNIPMGEELDDEAGNAAQQAEDGSDPSPRPSLSRKKSSVGRVNTRKHQAGNPSISNKMISGPISPPIESDQLVNRIGSSYIDAGPQSAKTPGSTYSSKSREGLGDPVTPGNDSAGGYFSSRGWDGDEEGGEGSGGYGDLGRKASLMDKVKGVVGGRKGR